MLNLLRKKSGLVFVMSLVTCWAALSVEPACAAVATMWEQLVQIGQGIDKQAQDELILEQNIIQAQNLVLMLERNPVGAVMPDFNQLARNAATIAALGNDIGTNAAGLDKRFVNSFSDPSNKKFGARMSVWTNMVGFDQNR